MANYLKMKFENNIEEFKKWCRTFPPLEVGEYRRFYKAGHFYMSLEKVNMKELGVTIVGKTFRRYKAEEQDFVSLDIDTENKIRNTIFKQAIENYHKKHGVEQ